MVSAVLCSALVSLPPQVHAGTSLMEVVIVTARKPEEILQNIYSLVSWLDNGRLQRIVIDDVRNLQSTASDFNDVFPGRCSRRVIPSPCHRQAVTAHARDQHQ